MLSDSGAKLQKSTSSNMKCIKIGLLAGTGFTGMSSYVEKLKNPSLDISKTSFQGGHSKIHNIQRNIDSVEFFIMIYEVSGLCCWRNGINYIFPDTLGVIFLLDISDLESLNELPTVIELVNKFVKIPYQGLLIGHKIDLKEKRKSSSELALQFANNHKFDYIEVSSLQNINVQESLDLIINKIISSFGIENLKTL